MAVPSIRSRLLLHFSVLALLSSAGVLLLAWFAYSRQRDADAVSDRLRNMQQGAYDNALFTKAFFLHDAQRVDFHRTGESHYLGSKHASDADLLAQLDALARMEGIQGSAPSKALARCAQAHREHIALFDTLLLRLRSRGMEDHGAEGRMRESAHALETAPGIGLADVLALRRLEKDYIIRHQTKYVERFNQRANALIEELGRRNAAGTIALLRAYMRDFDRIVDLDRTIGVRDHSALFARLCTVEEARSAAADSMLAEHVRVAATVERRALWAYAACALLIALLGLMTAAILSRRIARPIRSLAAAVEHFVASGFRTSMHAPSRDPRYKEVKELEANFAILQHELHGHIDQLNERVRERTVELLKEKENVQAKNEQITQSLRYARGLQDAILSTAGDLERALPGSFSLSMPKDIVGGDFLWVREVEVNGTKRVLFAVADCTGHGVPASLLSVMCHNALNEALGALDEPLPCLLLDRINELFSQFMVSGQDGGFGDGMTIALCSFDVELRRLVFAGSFQSIYIVDATGVTRIEGDPVFIGSEGQGRKERHFRDHYLEVEDGSMIYLTSDGLQDQFGGEHGKKFMRNRLGQLLAEAHRLSSAEQQRFIRDRFKAWKGDQEQVDDVLVVGIRVDMEMARLNKTGS